MSELNNYKKRLKKKKRMTKVWHALLESKITSENMKRIHGSVI